MSNRDQYEDQLAQLAGIYGETKEIITSNERFTSVESLSIEGGSTGKVLAQLFAAESMNKIDLSYAFEAWDQFHSYLRSGEYNKTETYSLMEKLVGQDQEWKKIAADYKEAGIADEDGDGAPSILFINGYACEMLLGVFYLEEYFSEFSVPEIQRKTEREHMKRLILGIHPDAGRFFDTPAP